MSARSKIVKAIASGLANKMDGVTPDYENNIYNNVTNKVVHFDDITDFPYIAVTPGPEYREDMPAHFSWSTLTVFIRIYVENNEDAQGELESLITDIETYVDTNLQLEYTNVNGVPITTTTNTIMAITTDEGLLDPNALGEVAVDIKYEKIRKT